MTRSLHGSVATQVLERTDAAVAPISTTWKWRGAASELETREIIDVLRELPGVTGIIVTLQSLRLTYAPDLFDEDSLRAALRRAGPYEITAKVASRPVRTLPFAPLEIG